MNRLLLITIPFLVWTTAPKLGDHQYYTIEVRAGESVEETEAGSVESVDEEVEAGSVESVDEEADEAEDDIDGQDINGGETSS